MGKTICIVVTDNPQHVDQARGCLQQSHDVSFHSFTPSQWRDGLEQSQFREQLGGGGAPALFAGVRPLTITQTGPSSIEYSNNVIAFPPPGSMARVQKIDELEAKAIENAIAQYKGNLTEAAKALGIGRATLYRKVKQYQIDPSLARKRKAA
jgi:DNA-binding NtrC family response regulator